MGFFSGFWSVFRGGGADVPAGGAAPDELEMALEHTEVPAINPATGLMMVGGQCGVDTAGNPFGSDLSDTLESAAGIGSFNSFDDPFDNGF